MKIKLPIRKGGAPKRPPKLKLKASVARSRRAPVVEDDDECFDEPEPNMKLSHAFVVVLVLHVIAVAGVFAFNTIKTRQNDIYAATKPEASAIHEPETAPETAPPPAVSQQASPAPAADQPGVHVIMAGETLTRIASQYGVSVADLQAANKIDDPTKIRVGTSLTIPAKGSVPVATTTTSAPEKPAVAQVTQPPAKPVPPAKAPESSGKTYEVVKGDNPVTIAKKFHVSESALMEANGITDPRKLQIGQKLKIPASAD